MNSPQPLIKIDPRDKEKQKDIQKALNLFAKHGYEVVIRPKKMEQTSFIR